jgi:phosphatidate cytidylyltransferase
MVLAGMTYHMAAFERGRDQSAADLSSTLFGILYLGWIGAYLVSLRSLSGGLWWTYLTFFTVWAADGFAYLVGVRWGRHPLSPRLSPKKTWEGYLGGIGGGILFGAFLGWLLPLLGADLPAWSGLWVGLAMGALPTLGDLGESMIKRQAGVKDSSHLLPGHGGVFDRIDSWLWAGVISYYLILYFWS